jgi:hypothetical protein
MSDLSAAKNLSLKNEKITDFLNAEYLDYKRLLSEAFAEFLKDNSKIVGLNWKQYTRSFNDGEPCTFNVYSLEPRLVPSTTEDEDEDEDEDRYGEDEPFEIYSEECALDAGLTKEDYQSLLTLRTIFGQIPESFMLEMFGDGYEINYTTDGFSVSECYHD